MWTTFLIALAGVGPGVYPAFPNGPDALDALLEEMARRSVLYFWEQAHPQTGLVKDRANNFGSDRYTVASIAATGFGLVALGIGAERGWLSRSAALERTRRTLQFVLSRAEGERGWFYHFLDWETGRRAWRSEVSSIDTALFLAGALFAAAYWDDPTVANAAQSLYARVDFQWMRTAGGKQPKAATLSHGWTPEVGFLPYRWDRYAEHFILYWLGIGAPNDPLPPESWWAWERNLGEYAGYRTFAVGPLFVHQYNHLFVDLRRWRDPRGWDYWEAAVQATWANRQFCLDQAERFRAFGPWVWGLSAADGPDGYRAYGAPPGRPVVDGTVAVLAMAAAYPFAPELVARSVWYLYQNCRDRLWGRYGFSGSFNRDRDWYATDVIGIDLGALVILLENARSGLVWRTMEGVPAVRRALNRIGFRPESGRDDD